MLCTNSLADNALQSIRHTVHTHTDLPNVPLPVAGSMASQQSLSTCFCGQVAVQRSFKGSLQDWHILGMQAGADALCPVRVPPPRPSCSSTRVRPSAPVEP